MAAKLADFGAASISMEADSHRVIMCNSWRGGTFEYKAPECLGRSALFDPFVADIFSLGVLLYTLVTHEFPFGGNDDIRSESVTNAIKAKMSEKKWVVNEDISHDTLLHSLLRQMLNPETLERITAHQVLVHPWLTKTTTPHNK